MHKRRRRKLTEQLHFVVFYEFLKLFCIFCLNNISKFHIHIHTYTAKTKAMCPSRRETKYNTYYNGRNTNHCFSSKFNGAIIRIWKMFVRVVLIANFTNLPAHQLFLFYDKKRTWRFLPYKFQTCKEIYCI